jgi:hypothetical protein
MTGSQVFGWFTIDHKLGDISGRRETFVQWGPEAAAKNGIDLSPFFATIVVFNAQTDAGAAGGPGLRMVLGNPGSSWNPSFNCHEMGHLFGLDHSFGTNPAPCATGDGRTGAYCDPWDIMSYGNAQTFQNAFSIQNGPGLNAPNLDKLGCIPSARIRTVATLFGTETITLAALGHPEANGFLTVKIPVDGSTSNHSTFMIEFRRSDRWDAGFQRDAVLVHEIRSDGLSYLQNAETNPELLPGQEFRIPRRNWNVKVESFDPVAATAVVSISGFDLVVKYTLDNPEHISPQPGTVVVVELSQFLGFTQGSGNPPVFGGVPILKSLIKNRVATQNAGVLTTDFFGLDPSIQYWIRAATVKPEWNVVSNVPWVADFLNEFPFTIVANGPTNLNLKGAITREIILH